MRRLLTVLVALCAAPAWADATDDAVPVARLLTDDSMIIIRVNAAEADPTPVLDALQQVFAAKDADPAASALGNIAEMKKAVAQAKGVAAQAGLTDIWMVLDTSDLAWFRVPFWAAWPEGKPLPGFLQNVPPGELIRSGELLGVGNAPQDSARWKGRTPVTRPGLAAALEATKDAAAVALFVPPAGFRRSIAELGGELPAVAGGGPTRFVADMKYAALTLGKGPDAAVELRFAADNAKDARQFAAVAGRLLAAGSMVDLMDEGKPVALARPKLTNGVLNLLKPKVDGATVSMRVTMPQVAKDLAGTLADAPGIGQRRLVQNNLKQIALACHNYEAVHGKLPGNILSKDGKPLLSWRVAILPYIEQENVYKQFKLDESWDSEHNLRWSKVVIKTYSNPRLQDKTLTTLLCPMGKGFALDEKGEGRRFTEYTDGTSNTWLAVDAAPDMAVPWTKPADFTPEEATVAARLLKGRVPPGLNAAYCDGSVRFHKAALPAKTLMALMTIGGGEVVSAD